MSDCPHRPSCDGCPLFEKSDRDAAKVKLDRIGQAFRAYEFLADLIPTEVAQGATLGYRNRARMVAENGQLGFYASGTRDFVPIQQCAVHAPEIEKLLDEVRNRLGQRVWDALAFVDARKGQNGGVVTFVGLPEMGLRRAAKHGQLEFGDWGVSIARDSETGAILSEEREVIREPGAALIAVGGLTFEAPSQAFFQVNVQTLEKIHVKMRELMGPEDLLVDAYCGVGTHGIALGEGKQVVGFDVSEEAVEAARRNAERNEVAAQFDQLDDAQTASWEWPDRPCTTVANPARAGLSPKFVRRVGESQTKTLLYLSCEPITLARDLSRLRTVGFEVEGVWAFDMAPRTEHVETLVKLTRGEAVARTSEGAFDVEKRWPTGVSGPLVDPRMVMQSVWFARVRGRAPHGKPPRVRGNAEIEVRRLRNIGDQSVIRVTMQGADVRQLRTRLRAWGHPVVGDTEFGDSSTNAMMERHEWLDRPILHCALTQTRDESFEAAVPEELLPFFRLPASYFEIPPK